MKVTKRILVSLLAAALLVISCAAVSAADLSASSFRDYDPNAWYASAVSHAVENGLLVGKSRDTLDPNGLLLRAEMAAIVNRAFGCYKQADISRYADVPADKWYYRDMQLAVQMGTYNGASDTSMEPERPITRQEAMAVVARALVLDPERYRDTDLSKYQDAAQIAPWALPYIKSMVACGYLIGRPSGLAPRENITRAEFAQIFERILRGYILTKGTYTEDFEGNLLIRTKDVTLKDMTVRGDLILGNGVADGTIVLDNVTVTGRLLVWGGGTEAVYCQNGTNMPEVVVSRVDGPVKVIFDRDSTLAVLDTIQTSITRRASAFEETEIIFFDTSGIREAQKSLNAQAYENRITVTVPAHLFALVGDTEVKAEIRNESALETYRVEIRRSADDELLCEPISLAPGASVASITLKEPAVFGNVPCKVTVTSSRGSETVGTLVLELTLHTSYLWPEEVY